MDGTPALLSGTFASRYTVERELGRGASATVYLARDTQRGQAVAIKLLRPELAESLGAERFLREIKVNEKLHHPHIASVLDSGEHDGRLYFVLPHMEGGSLRQMLQREKQLPIEAAIAIARTVAEALDYAHKQGLIHRDVKPENILFTSGQACLVDFGIARAIERAIDESTTETGLVRGTPAYMSPEQASGSRNYDGRSDQYSLACVLYEMLAGVPAFLGATPEATIAMRFKHSPRELRVYRPTVPPAVEAVIQKALSITAADRYATSGEFGNALDTAMRAPQIEPRTSGPSAWNTPSRKWALGGAAVFAVALAAAASIGGRAIWGTRTPPIDTTKYFVIPIEGDVSAPRSQTYDLMLQSMGRWKGVTIVDRFTMRNVLGSDSALVNERQALKAARSVGAGRYVRARLSGGANGLRLYGALFDAGEGTRLHEASVSLPLDLRGADSILASLARQLLLRGANAPVSGTTVLPAMQFYLAASAAREAFNLRLADSLLLAALDADHDFALASMRLAEIRSWREQPTSLWASWAERATSGKLSAARERDVARALYAMSHGDFEHACPLYRKLTQENAEDFAMWYGRATCLRSDKIVVRNARSPSGWTFRTSYQEAVNSYVRAFELAPALHRTFQAGAYNNLRKLLFTDASLLRDGLAAPPDTSRFFARPAWQGDSLLFVPYPSWKVQRNLAPVPTSTREAVQRQREVFVRVTRAWAAALPNNPGTKEAVAIALDLVGVPTALDTLRAARSFAQEPLHRLRLGAEEVFLLVASGRNDLASLKRAVRLGDSLLATISESREEAVIVAPVAALLGQCRTAGHLAASAADPLSASFLGVPLYVYATAESLTVFSALGCGSATDTMGLSWLGQAARSIEQTKPADAQNRLEAALVSRVLRLRVDVDTPRIERLTKASGSAVLAARLLVSRRPDSVRALLRHLREKRGAGWTADIVPDAVLVEAMLLAQARDSAEALLSLDPLLTRPTWLELLIDRPVGAAALVRAAALRAHLAAAQGDSRNAKRWSQFVTTLWSNPDPELKPQLEKLRRIGRM